jgi:hypothetical protein
MDYLSSLDIAQNVLEKYQRDQPKWWKRMDGTPILNDVAVRMAFAYSYHVANAMRTVESEMVEASQTALAKSSVQIAFRRLNDLLNTQSKCVEGFEDF